LENSSRKVKIVGFDNHKGSSRRSLPLWKNRMVGDVTESRLLNLKNIILLEEGIREENGLACVYAIRYLNRRMIDYIATDAPLKSGCLFAMSHFCKEAGAEWNWDHPKVRNCRVMYSYFSIWLIFNNLTPSAAKQRIRSRGVERQISRRQGLESYTWRNMFRWRSWEKSGSIRCRKNIDLITYVN